MSTPIKKVLDKPMDRKQFLTYMGGAFVTVIGMRGLISAFTPEDNSTSQSRTSGYGSSNYGS